MIQTTNSMSRRKRRAFRFQSFGVPEALTGRRQWAGWKADFPFPLEVGRPMHCGIALPTKPETWADFRTACDRRFEWSLDGVAYMVTKYDPFLLVTLQGAAHRGRLSRSAREVVRACRTYAEVSPGDQEVTLVFAVDPEEVRQLGHPVPPEAFPDDCPLHLYEGRVASWPRGFYVPLSGMFIDFDNQVRIIELKENQ